MLKICGAAGGVRARGFRVAYPARTTEKPLTTGQHRECRSSALKKQTTPGRNDLEVAVRAGTPSNLAVG